MWILKQKTSFWSKPHKYNYIFITATFMMDDLYTYLQFINHF